MKSFTAKFIIRSIIVILGAFSTIYFIFNLLANDFIIRNAEENDLRVRVHNNFAESVAMSTVQGWRHLSMDWALTFLGLPADITPAESFPLALLSDTLSENYIIVTTRDLVFASGNTLENADMVTYRNENMDKRLFFAEYYQQNQHLFEIDEIVTVRSDDRIFLLRSVSTYYFEGQEFQPPPSVFSILFFAEVTDIIGFRNNINQLLIISLSLAGLIILAVTLTMSSRLNQSIEKLSDYAEDLGHGKFDAKVTTLRYSEFQRLASSMTDMSNMLVAYETNQKQFFQNASHELRTPLMAVQCYSEGILADVFEPKEASVIINSEIERMNELVSSILYLSRIEHQTFQPEVVSINEFLTDCHTQIKVLADNNNINLRLTPLEKDLFIHVDIPLLERAVLNILSNALRYAQTEISILVESYIDRNIFTNFKQEMIRISIANDGKHVDEADLPHLFERFYKGAGGNTGLGLSITKEIILALDGQISVKNIENGVCFTFTLLAYENKTTETS